MELGVAGAPLSLPRVCVLLGWAWRSCVMPSCLSAGSVPLTEGLVVLPGCFLP